MLCIYVILTQSLGLGPAAEASPGGVLDMQIHRLHIRPTESETLGAGAQEIGFQTALQGILAHSKVWMRTMDVIEHFLPKRKTIRKKSSMLRINKVIVYKLAKHEYCERRT